MSGVVIVAPAPVIQYDTQGQAHQVQSQRRAAELEVVLTRDLTITTLPTRSRERMPTSLANTRSGGNR